MTPLACDRGPHLTVPPASRSAAVDDRAEPWWRQADSLPIVGTEATVEFPTIVVAHHRSRPYVVVDVDGPDTVTARPTVGAPPAADVGTPCLITYTTAAGRLSREAIVLSSGPGGIIVQLHLDQRRLPHCRRPMRALVEVPGTGLGVIEGVTEDVALDGIRVRVPMALPADRRAFVSLRTSHQVPILAITRIVASGPILDAGIYFARADFTLVSAHDQLRLFALMDWHAVQPTGRTEGRGPSRRHLVGRMPSAAADGRRR